MVAKRSDSAIRIPPTRRAVILGASNVTLGLTTLTETARNAWGRPLDLMVAAGFGRSYGVDSSLLGRRLPGIISCGLWEQLAARPQLPTAALVTDIGNDIVYGSDTNQIIEWVEICLERLSGQVDRLVVTRLPQETIFETPPGKFHLLRSMFFPTSRVQWDDVLVRVEEVNERITEFANRYHAYVIQPDQHWFGWDPIHICRSQRAAAWQKILSCWTDGRPTMTTRGSFRRWRTVRKARPLQWHRWGVKRHRAQPACKLPDGSTLSLF